MQPIWKIQRPFLVAIVGGSGSGKTWLADRLHKHLGKVSSRLSLDNYYRDRSHLSLQARTRINFDHPRAIDWDAFQQTLESCSVGKTVQIPEYDFATHSRIQGQRLFHPKSIVLIDGLWLLRSQRVRPLFDYKVFVDCDADTRLARRLKRDCAERRRTEMSIKHQFTTTVLPMHERFVAPQKRWADNIFPSTPGEQAIAELADHLKTMVLASL